MRLLLPLLLTLLLLAGCQRDDRPVKYIAFVGRYTNAADTLPANQQKNHTFEQLHQAILEQYVAELNEELTDYRLELKPFDMRQTPAGSDSVYKLIAQDTSIVAVLDNTWGVHIAAAAPIIKQHNIPVIALNADHNSLDFGNSAVFIGNSDGVPEDLAVYIDKAMKDGSVNFLTERDYALTQGYYASFRKHGIKVNKVFEVQTTKVLNDDSLKLIRAQLLDYYRAHPEEKNRLLVINVHSVWGNPLIQLLDRSLDGMRILGHAYIANGNGLEGFGQGNTNNLVLITNPTDALTRKASQDLKRFLQEKPDVFNNVNAPLFVKRCIDAMSIIRHATVPDTTTQPAVLAAIAANQGNEAHAKNPLVASRGSVRGALQKLRRSTLAGVLDLYDFDSSLVLMPDLHFSRYAGGRLHSMPLQLNSQRRVIPNLLFGMEIQDIYDLDVNSNSFTADFYYWVKMDTSNVGAEKYISFQNMKSSQSDRELVIEKHEGNQIYKLFRVSGIFYVNYELQNFPFDKQELSVNVEILSPVDRLKISFDQSALMLDPHTIEKFKVTGWNKKDYYVTVDNIITRSIKGDPLGEPGTLKKFKSFSFRLNVERIVLGSLLQIILPLILIGLIAVSVLFIRDLTFENVGEVSVGVFLAIITFSISLSDLIPSSNYLTRADLLFWLTFLVVFGSFIVIIVLNSLYKADVVQQKNVRTLRTLLAIFYPLAVIYVLLW